MSNNSATILKLMSSSKDEGELEYYLNSTADYSISNPKLGLSAGRGRVMAAKADIKHANANYNMHRTSNGIWVLLDPIRRLIQEIPKAIEYRTQRLVNPQLPEDAVATEIGILRMGMVGKCMLGTWVNPSEEARFHSQSRRQRLASYQQIITAN